MSTSTDERIKCYATVRQKLAEIMNKSQAKHHKVKTELGMVWKTDESEIKLCGTIKTKETGVGVEIIYQIKKDDKIIEKRELVKFADMKNLLTKSAIRPRHKMVTEKIKLPTKPNKNNRIEVNKNV
jgi:hypothetical protein